MRPDPGGDAVSSSSSRSRKGSFADLHTPAASGAPTTFFMAREEDALGGAARGSRRSSASGKSVKADAACKAGSPEETRAVGAALQDSEYGVQSIEEALGHAFSEGGEESGEESGARYLRRGKRRPDQIASMDTSRHQSPRLPHLSTPQSTRLPPLSQPLTPLQLESPFQCSTPKSGSFRSLRLSDEEESVTDSASQAVTSGGEEEDEDVYHGDGGFDMSGAAPELVMPSLSMPSRRPFTAKGKGMGRVKVLLAGPNGAGKTSLIRAIVQQCPDIVHVDPITTLPPPLSTPRPRSRGKKSDKSGTQHITEIYASTRAYPAWWSEMDDGNVLLRRRKSMGDTVLERNVCFVDTPGGNVEGVVKFVEGLLGRCADLNGMSDGDVLGVLGGSGGCQIDVCLFIFPDDWQAEDMEYCRRLSQLTNIVPVIGKADMLDSDGYTTRKHDLLQDLEAAGIQPFLFGGAIPRTSISSQTTITDPINPLNATIPTPRSTPPYAISTLPSTEDVEMDASLLMASSYNLPLHHSDLQDLISALFEPENMAWLRHSAIRKFLLWRRNRSATGLGIREHIAFARSNNQRLQQQRHSNSNSSSSLLSTPTPSQVLVARHQNTNATTSPFNLSSSALGHGLNDFTRARLRDHVAAEERLAQVQLARWAADLQRSLREERRAFEELAQGHRASWLLERLNEEVQDGKIGVVNRGGDLQVASWARKESRGRGKGRKELELPSWARSGREGDGDGGEVGLMWRDPLGLCGLGDGVARGLGICVKVLGGGVVVGALFMAVGRAWGVDGGSWFRT